MATAHTHSQKTANVANSIELLSDSLAFGIVFTIALTIVQRGLGFLRGILFCRYLSDEQLGQWSMIFSFLMLLAPLAALGLPGSFARFVEHYVQQGQIRTFLRRIAKISAIVTLLLSASMCLFPVTFSRLVFRSDEHPAVINAMAFTLIAVAASNFLVSLIESLRQVRLVAIIRFVQGVSFAGFGVAMILTWEKSVVAATLAFGLACLFSSLPAVWFIWKHQTVLVDSGEHLSHSRMWARIAPFAIWLWASNLVWNLFEVADRYMLVQWSSCSAAQAHGYVGQYHSARVVPMLLVGVAVVLEGILTPFITAMWEKKKITEAGAQLTFALKLLTFSFTVGSVLILLLSPILFDTILSGRYNDGLAVLPTTLLYSTWFSMFLFGQIYLWVAERGKWVFAITALGLVLNLVLNALLIPTMELWGAVVATTVATLFCLLATLAANVQAGNKIPAQAWIISSLPLTLLLPFKIALVASLIFIGLAGSTHLIFDQKEKDQAFKKLLDLTGKFTGRFQGS